MFAAVAPTPPWLASPPSATAPAEARRRVFARSKPPKCQSRPALWPIAVAPAAVPVPPWPTAVALAPEPSELNPTDTLFTPAEPPEKPAFVPMLVEPAAATAGPALKPTDVSLAPMANAREPIADALIAAPVVALSPQAVLVATVAVPIAGLAIAPAIGRAGRALSRRCCRRECKCRAQRNCRAERRILVRVISSYPLFVGIPVNSK